MRPSRVALLLAFAGLIGLFFWLDLERFLTPEFFSAQREAIAAFQAQNPWVTALAFFAIYILVTGASLPGAAILTLIAGALFGLVQGVIIVSFASTLGATLAFTIARYLFRDAVRSKFGQHLGAIDRGIEKDGAFYLFAMRLVPAVPFFVINLAMALTPLSTWRFYWVSQLGMIFGHRRLRERGGRARAGCVRRRHPFPHPVDFLCPLGPRPPHRQEDSGRREGAQGAQRVQEAQALRQQPGGDRRRLRRLGRGAHRGDGEGQGHPDRAPSHGRRLPEHGLRAEQVPDPFRQDAVLCGAGAGVWVQEREGGV